MYHIGELSTDARPTHRSCVGRQLTDVTYMIHDPNLLVMLRQCSFEKLCLFAPIKLAQGLNSHKKVAHDFTVVTTRESQSKCRHNTESVHTKWLKCSLGPVQLSAVGCGSDMCWSDATFELISFVETWASLGSDFHFLICTRIDIVQAFPWS